MPESPNRPWWWWAGVALVAVVAVSVLVRLAGHDLYTQDTTAIIDGANRSLDCLRDGVLRACRYHPETRTTDINPYPLLQYLPATLFAGLGASDDTNRTLLIWLNTVAVAAMIVIVARRGARLGGTGLAVAGAVAMTTGMLAPYAGQSFGEPLVMLAVVALCRLCVARRATPWLVPVAALATVGKETMLPVVVAFAAGFVLLSGGRGDVVRRKAQWVALGAGIGVAANLAFNVFRFGGITNEQYLLEARPGPAAAAANTVSLLVAPNGGLVWFWWTAVVALVIVVAAVVVPGWVVGDAAGDRLARRRVRLGAAAVAGGFAVGLGSLGFWWGPFGWYSWGPRLLLPFVPPLIMAAVELVGRPLGARAERAWLVPVAAVAVGVATVLFVPAVAEVFAPESWNTHQLATLEDRPECRTVDLRGDQGYGPFHDCLMTMAWRTSAMPLTEAVAGASRQAGAWFWLTALGAVGAVWWWVAVSRRDDAAGGTADDLATPADQRQ